MSGVFGRLAACAALATVAKSSCDLPNNVAGQDKFQLMNMAYLECKKTATINQQALCLCSDNQMTEVAGCSYDWINPWIATVYRDKIKFCGSISGSSTSSLSGSDTSLPSLASGSLSSANSNSSNTAHLTTPQKLFFVMVGICACLCVCGSIGALVAMKGGFKKSKTKPTQQYYENEEEDDYEAQQYNQGYPGDYPQQEGGEAQEERWDLEPSPVVQGEGY